MFFLTRDLGDYPNDFRLSQQMEGNCLDIISQHQQQHSRITTVSTADLLEDKQWITEKQCLTVSETEPN